jgi:serine O-acetyltransferase
MNYVKKLMVGIRDDFRAYSGSFKHFYRPLIKIHFYCNLNFRLSHFFYQLRLLPIARIFWLFNRIVFAVDIDPGAQLKGGMLIVHGIGIVIGRYVIAEGFFKIYHGATLGGNNGKELIFHNTLLKQPYLRANVVIGIRSAVLGPVIIGRGAVVGTNALITRDVADNSVMIGNNQILKNV